MSSRPAQEELSHHTISFVERRDVEDYACGRLTSSEQVSRVEEALLDDGAVRDIVRERVKAVHEQGGHATQGRLFEALQDLRSAAHSCTALEDVYRQLVRHAERPDALRFLEGRRAVFERAAGTLMEPLREQLADVPDTIPEQMVLLARESREGLGRRLENDPHGAIASLDDLHWPLMQGLRTLVHLPWSLDTKLLIADVHASLREELEWGAWHLQHRTPR